MRGCVRYRDATLTRESTTATLYIRELSKPLDEYTAVTALGGSQTFTCEYHGDSGVGGVTWTYNDLALPAGYTITEGSYVTGSKKWESVLTLNLIIKSSGGALKCAYSFSGTGDDIKSTTNFRVRSVDALAAEEVSSEASHTITCNYKGTDDPSVSWTVAGSIVLDSDDGITITPGTLNTGTNERSDELTILGRTYSDASKVIVCKYSFTNPKAELTAKTVLKFRGLNARLNTKYYSIGAAVTMECSLGVGSDGAVPTSTAWYKNYVDTDSTPIAYTDPYDVETESSITNGLFKTTLTIKTAGITIENAGSYRCMFVVSDTENYHSEGTLVVRIVTKTPTDANIYSYTNAGLKLSCTLDASDAQSGITWRGPDGVIGTSQYSYEESNDYIHILYLASSDSSGEYKCTFAFAEGTLTVPEGVFSNVNLNLIEMVSPAALYSTYGAGVMVTLSCQVTSPSQLELRFHNGSQDLAASSTKLEGGKTKAEYVITIDAASKGDTFTCRKSELEFSPTSSTLTVFSISTPLVTPTRGNSEDNINLVCVAESHADITTPTFTWLLGESAATETADANVVAEDSSTVSSTLPITISSTNDARVYKCIVTYTGLAAGTNLESATTITMNTKPVSLRVWIGSGVAVLTCILLVLAGFCITKKKSKGGSAGTENEFKLNKKTTNLQENNGPVPPTPDHYNYCNDDIILHPSNLYSDTSEIVSHRSGKLHDDTIIHNKTACA
ncbi:uncharacterized protein LOC134813803 [Bolinopsis microptera]|uniref:uncharacterized protein LOC134813803 n=1 Tax=Bolinopsis microptera TaxID=2820187 RepID=UPI0030791856